MPRFDQSFSGICEQNLQDTMQLKQRYLDAKAKRVPKSKDKKQQDSIQSSVHVQQKFLKRSADDLDPGGAAGPGDTSFEPPVKLQCTAQPQQHPNPEGLTKFSVEIVQQLEFTTSTANSQPQQISANVTVKTHANASVKSDVSSPKSNPSPAAGAAHQKQPNVGLDVIGTLVECVKQEPDNDFADLDQCAFPDLIGDDTNDEIISSATFNDLISDISNYPDYELMKDFDFDDKTDSAVNALKMEDVKEMPPQQNTLDAKSAPGQQNYSPPVFDKARMAAASGGGYPNMDFAKTELSPAAQTLKQMAEQHQHKNQLGLSFAPSSRAANPRSPFPEFPFQPSEYGGSPNGGGNFHKSSPGGFSQPEMIKQEMFPGSGEFDLKRGKGGAGGGIYKQQQYSPYGSPSASGHGSPGYLPRGAGPGGPGGPGGPFGGGTPPRPPSGPGGNGSGASVHINQAQQLNISQQSHGHTIQVSAGQHVHLSGDLKGNVSIAAQQGMHFSQGAAGGASSSQQQQGSTNAGQQQQQHSQHSPMSAPQQHQNSPMQQGGMGSQGPMNHQGSHLGGDMHGGNQAMGGGMPGMSGMPSSGNMPGPESMPGNMGMSGGNMGHNSGMGGLNGSMGGSAGGMPGSMGGMHPGMHHVGGMGGSHSDTYSLSQTQTINFTQQSLRRAGGPGVPNPMGASSGPMGSSSPMGCPGGPMGTPNGMGPRLLNAQQSLEQQKLLHQQQMMRAQQQQQAAMQQQLVRPPPPDYKASAGLMQGMQPRYAATPPNMRRMPHQPMPPSGPMMRSNMFLLPQQQQQQQQQHQPQMQQRAVMYSRQQGSLPGMDQHNSSEWRHLLMAQQQQQQGSNFNPMRPSFQQGFNVNSNNIQQMTVLQHQQLRAQQQGMGGLSGSQQGLNQGLIQGQVLSQSNNPMTQMNNMNQAMLHMQQQQQQQQQQQSLMQQQNSHMSMSNIHLQQSQSISVSNQQQQQQTNLNPQPDFNFEFLDNLAGSGDSGTFTDQDLLNSFDSEAGFTLDF